MTSTLFLGLVIGISFGYALAFFIDKVDKESKHDRG
jgi:hypothetical protein